jgi:hypothetical protein
MWSRLVVLAGCVALLAGCVPAFDLTGGEWAKPGASVAQATLDQTECARLGYRTGRTPDLLLGGVIDIGRLGLERGAQARDYADCLTRRGYKPAETTS